MTKSQSDGIREGGLDSNLAPIYCLTGCTAVGKTELALRWAERNAAEIVSCDSLLFYRGMDIGTAKPNAEEQARVRHHLIDILEPSEPMDVARYIALASVCVRDIQSRGRNVLVVGGSGFYLKSFFVPVVDSVVVSPEARSEANTLMEAGLHVAVEELRRRNPDGLGRLDTQNPRRVVKALERCIESGRTLMELAANFAREDNALISAPKQLVALERDKDSLELRIDLRAKQMIEAGLVEEVQALALRGFERNPSAYNAIGYRETLAYLRGDYDRMELHARIAFNTRRLAKKQRTWLRGQLPFARQLTLSGQIDELLDDLFVLAST